MEDGSIETNTERIMIQNYRHFSSHCILDFLVDITLFDIYQSFLFTLN